MENSVDNRFLDPSYWKVQSQIRPQVWLDSVHSRLLLHFIFNLFGLPSCKQHSTPHPHTTQESGPA